jgi:hypothetical protein
MFYNGSAYAGIFRNKRFIRAATLSLLESGNIGLVIVAA